MAQCSPVKWCFSVFFTKVQSATLASSQTSEGLAGNSYAMMAKQVYYTACATDGTKKVLMDNESADMERHL